MLLKTRDQLRARLRERKLRIGELEQQCREQQNTIKNLQRRVGELEREVQRLESQLSEDVVQLPDDPPVKGHRYGPALIALCLELVKLVGFRAAQKTLLAVFAFLKVEQDVPHWTTIRTWALRVGVARMSAVCEPADDWIWMPDHSNQIGQEKLLVVMGVRAANLPPPGEALKHKDMRVLCVQPGVSWKKEDVLQKYQELTEQFGVPRAILSDGAAELRESAAALMEQRQDGESPGLVLGDLKHFAANQFKKLIGDSEAFKAFLSQVGNCRSRAQQTELGYLVPPSMKQKSRFMNLKPLLDWAAMVEWVLNAPGADCRKYASQERLQEKFGWLADFTDKLQVWRECQTVISKCLTFINKQGLQKGTTRRLYKEIADDLNETATRDLARRLLAFVHRAETQLKSGERLPLSTEILESSFGLYKQLERQHAKGGFTTLAAAFPILLSEVTPKEVSASLSRVANQDVKSWCEQNLETTLAAKRKQTRLEHKTANQKRATKMNTSA